MTRDEVADLLQQGRELDGIMLDERGVVLARGKVRIEGATLVALDFGNATALQVKYGAARCMLPLQAPMPVQKGKAFNLEFARQQ